MTNNTSAIDKSQSTARGLRGKLAPVSIVIATKAVTMVALLVVFYVIAFFAAVKVVPMTMNIIKAGTGVTLDMPIETVVSFWVVPALFLVALVFVLVLVTMRAVWRLRSRVVIAVSRWAFGVTPETAQAGQTAPLRTKSVRKQIINTTKAA